MGDATQFWLSAALIGTVFFALAVQVWYMHQVVRSLQEYLVAVQDPAIVVLKEVAEVESRLKTRLDAVETLTVERLQRSNELADEAGRHYRMARSTEERTRRHAERVEEAEFADGEGEEAPWDLAASQDGQPAQEVVADQPASTLAAWVFNRRRR